MSSVVQRAVAAGPPVVPADSPTRGIAFLTGGVAVFSLQDVVIKSFAGSDYPVLETVFFRSVLAMLLLAAVGWRVEGRRAFTTRRPGLHLLRGLLGVLSYTSYYMAFAVLPLAEAVALFFAAPLFLTALSVVVLGEQVGPRRWAAVAVGFAGVLVMLRPGAAVFEPAALLSVLAALAYAGMQMVTRRLAANDSGICMSVSINFWYLAVAVVSGVVVGGAAPAAGLHPSLVFLMRPWVMPALSDFLLLSSLGFVAAAGFFCLARAYSVAPASVVAPFEYSMMLWALLWGFLFFGEVPEPVVMLGVAMTAGAGLYVLHRERVNMPRAGE